MIAGQLCFDRFTQSWSQRLPEGDALSSRYVLQGPLQLDREDFGGRVLLVDSGEGSALVEFPSVQARVQVRQGEQRESLKACLDVADRMREWREAGADWRDLVAAVDPLILVADISDLLKSDGVEDVLGDNAPQLRSVFHAPFSELEFTTERVPAPRARRFSRRALQVLAARSEDWIRAGASGITPRTVEALVRDEIEDVYENRVAARLVDDVRRHLKGVLGVYAELSPLVQTISGPYRKQVRLAHLWGRVPPDDDLRGALERRRQRLEGLLRFTDELLDSQLYAGVPRRARVGQPIRMTNLLLQDANYRAVRKVWLEWWRVRGEQGSIEARRGEQLSEAEAFFDFTFLALSRALLHLEAEAPESPPSGSAVTTPWGELRLEQTSPVDPGSWWIQSPTTGYRGIAIAVACEVLGGSAADVARRLRQLEQDVAVTGCRDAFVLLPGTMHDLDEVGRSTYDGSCLAPLDRGLTAECNVWIIPVSPLDLESTERIERALRWAVLSVAWLSYPPKISLPRAAASAIGERPFLRPAADAHDVLVTSVPEERDAKTIRHLLDQEARRSRQRLRGAGNLDAELIERFSAELDGAYLRLSALGSCPVCAGSAGLEARAAETFEATCRNCSTRWGLRHDPVAPDGSDRVPYLWLGEDLSSLPVGDTLGRWLGRDIMAEPCQHRDGAYGEDLVNPWTGRCTAAAQRTASCGRCAASMPEQEVHVRDAR